MVLLSDNPSNEDTLGFEGMAEILHTVIRDMPEPPFTIGIFGEWGCGKTTLMKMVQARLNENEVKTVWFNAWKYDGKEVIWNALIQQIFYTIKEDPDLEQTERGKYLKARIKSAASNLAKYAAKVGVSLIPGGFVKPEVVDSVAEGLRPLNANDEQFEFINRFESEFDELVSAYLGNENRYLVVFVDDLDRCLPETAIAVMEALKLYLDRAVAALKFLYH
ncbi:MAG: P-loop NTPase fold protein [Prochloraceae cyanobacterium]|nr:P-loop NTPase fold protein [Prochloraceae cyanobacterium]